MLKYKAQILLEIELLSESSFGAWDEAEILGKILYDKIPARKINIINTHIITEPSDEEFLDKFFNYRGELYEIVE